MHHVPEPQGGMTSEHHARLLEIIAEVTVDAGVMLQFVGLNELQGRKQEGNDQVYLCPIFV